MCMAQGLIEIMRGIKHGWMAMSLTSPVRTQNVLVKMVIFEAIACLKKIEKSSQSEVMRLLPLRSPWKLCFFFRSGKRL